MCPLPVCRLLNCILPEILASVSSCPIHTTTIDWNGKEVHWGDIGCSLKIPAGAVPYGQTVKLAIMCRLRGAFVLPKSLECVSPVYLILTSPKIQFVKTVQLSLHHWARVGDEQSCSSMVFVSAPSTPNDLDHPESPVFLRPVGGGLFPVNSCVGTISLNTFSWWATARSLIGGVVGYISSMFKGI